MILSSLLGMMRYSQSIQSNKVIISLHFYIYKYILIYFQKFKIEFIFCWQISIKISASWDYCFWWKWPDMSEVATIGSWWYFCNMLRKEYCSWFCVLCDAKHSDILQSPVVVYVTCFIAHPGCRNFLSEHCDTIFIQQLRGEEFLSLLLLL